MSGVSESSGFHITVSNSSDTAIAREALKNKNVCGIEHPDAKLASSTVEKLMQLNIKHLKGLGVYRMPKKLADADHRPFSKLLGWLLYDSKRQIFVNRSICPPPETKVTFVPYPKLTIVKQKPCPPCPKVEKKPIKRPIKKPVKPPPKGTKKLEWENP